MILVFGDAIIDRYEWYETRDSHGLDECCTENTPVYRRVGSKEKPGGAEAVYAMVKKMTNAPLQLVCQSRLTRSSKTRVFVDGKFIGRYDVDLEVNGLGDYVNVDGFFPSVVLVSDYGKGVVCERTMTAVRKACPDAKVIVDPYRGRTADFYSPLQPWAFKVSDGNWDTDYTSVDRLCLTSGSQGYQAYGVSFYTESASGSPELPRGMEVVDPTGAGDQFLAAIGVAVLEGYSWLEACKFGNIAAGWNCGHLGTEPAPRDVVFGEEPCRRNQGTRSSTESL